MKGNWKAYSQVVNGKWIYIAGRQIDTSKPLHGGNIEYTGEYTENRELIETLCEMLNKD